MFSKATKGAEPTELTAAHLPRKPTVASLIGQDVVLRGDLTTSGDIHLDGTIEGDLKTGHLTIGESGCVKGTIEADSVEVRGRVYGTVRARQVRLWATAQVEGDISHSELSIESGAHFEGRSQIVAPAPIISSPIALNVAAE